MTRLLRKIVSESKKVWDSTDFKAARACCESLCYYGASVQNVQLSTYDMQVFKRGRLKISTGGGNKSRKIHMAALVIHSPFFLFDLINMYE